MGNMKSNIKKIALALVLLVAISIYFVFGLYGKYTSDKDNNGGANVAGIKCEINVSDTSDPNEYRYKEISGIDYNLLYFTRESKKEAETTIRRFVKCEKLEESHTSGLYYRKLL